MIKYNDNYILGGVKILDGLFIGDQYVCQDDEFLKNNQINYIINTSSNIFKNNFLKKKFYLKINFKENNIFDYKNKVFEDFYNFLNEANDNGNGCLVFSLKGTNKVTSLILMYLIYRYNWNYNKSIEYLKNKKYNLKLKKKFKDKILNFENEISKIKKLSNNWNEFFSYHKDEEILISNTFINSNIISKFKLKGISKNKNNKNKKIKWNLKKNNKQKIHNSENKSILNFEKKLILKESQSEKNLKETDNDNIISLFINKKNNEKNYFPENKVLIKKSNYISKVSTYLSEESNNKNIKKNNENTSVKPLKTSIFKKKNQDSSLNSHEKAENQKNKIDSKNINKYLNFSFNDNFNKQKNKLIKNKINSSLYNNIQFKEKTKNKLKFNFDNFKEIPYIKKKTKKNIFNNFKRPNSAPLKEENEYINFFKTNFDLNNRNLISFKNKK